MAGLTPDEWQALSPKLDEVLGLETAERVVWLAELRLTNPALAAQLESLLGDHSRLAHDGFLEKSPVDLSTVRNLTGQSLGSYRLISQIGQGGMGTVWLAERNDGRFERKVAIKFLNFALLGNSGEERFKREGIILGRLSHPHIAELLDAGVSETGQPYLVLEHVDGEHIDRYCDENNLGIDDRIRLFIDALDAVSQAHANLIVHRDLKPSNVLVRRDGNVKLLDFGIAKLLENERHPGEAQLTADGGNALTPEYAAPEQLTGETVTTATDVYALGILLYVLLTGRHPAEMTKHSPAQLVQAILTIEPESPSKVVSPTTRDGRHTAENAAHRSSTPEKLSRALRGDLDTIVAKAVKKNPQERYASVKELAEDLHRYLRKEPISARPDSFSYRAGKFVRRNRTRIAVAMLIAAVLILSPTAVWLISHRTDRMAQYQQRRVTANPTDRPVRDAAISPDGKYIGFGDRQGLHLSLVDTAVVQDIALPVVANKAPGDWTFGSWYPDSKRILASVGRPNEGGTLWSISISGNDAKKIAEIDELTGVAKLSPDGTKIAYRTSPGYPGAHEIWMMGADGRNPHRIKTAGRRSSFLDVGWSPGGDRLDYWYFSHQEDKRDLQVMSCALDGSNDVMIVNEQRMGSFTWVTPERLVFSKSGDPGGIESANLWELRVARDGTPQSSPRRITDWSGFSVDGMSASADGKRFQFMRGISRVSIFLADWENDSKRIKNLRPFEIDDNYNLLLSWTPDSRELIFSSKRAATRLMYKQAIAQGAVSQLVTNTPGMNFYIARPTSNGASLILEGTGTGPNDLGLYRAPIQGGVPQLLFKSDGFVQYWCTTGGQDICVYGQMAPQKDEFVVYAFDGMGEHRGEILRIPLEPNSSARIGDDYSWQLSPDGSRIAFMKRRADRVRLIALDGSPETAIMLKSRTGFELNWAADSQSLFVSTRAGTSVGVTHVDLQGNEHPIWSSPEAGWASAMQSPDRKHLAIMSVATDGNAWVIDNF